LIACVSRAYSAEAVPPPTREDILLELGDPDQVARVAAVPLVGSLGPPAALGILSGVFAEEDDPLARSRAVAALTRFEGLGAGRQDAELRMQALNALAHSSGGGRSMSWRAACARTASPRSA
jgi:hypothetical protein